ncbi:MAG: excinuclease ABC subunit UvrC [Dehalococcoidales bacterium]|nr:excinuclease ABC subunit UvrC [Dehalococcoidales bacterium]
MTNSLTEQLKQLPTAPGVYLMKDAAGNIIYIGKAANLGKRVRSYFTSGQKLSAKTRRMVNRVRDIDFFVTSSEQEALILELNLIKRHRPLYNVSLKDDKTFPYLKIDTDNDWPRIYVTRRLEQNSGRYFGPFASAGSVRQTLKVLKEIFPSRSCAKNITGSAPRPCLQYYIRRCLGPCIGSVSKDEYAEVIRQIVLFLEGKQDKIIRELVGRMEEAARDLDFEKAALLRDRIQAVRQVIEGQRLATRVRGEQDVIAFVQDRSRAYAQVFFVRDGRLVGRDSFILEGTSSEKPSRIMTSFVEQFYHSAPGIPPLLLLQHPLEDKVVVGNWLQRKRGGSVRIQIPRRGSRKELVDIVAENARQGLEQLKIKRLASPKVLKSALTEIKRELDLPRLPYRLEGYDISNIQGELAVGSMVVFEKGSPVTSRYRRFRIKTVSGADDYAMLAEVLGRRFKRFSSAADDWAVLPDLILVDGGRGQLNAALSVIDKAGVGPVPVIGLAKENEEIFIPRRTEPVVLSRSSPGLQLLERVRDEAHRFALGYHRRVRSRAGITSALDAVPGIGPKRRRSLLRRFGSLAGIRRASPDELAAVDNMNPELARKVKEYL